MARGIIAANYPKAVDTAQGTNDLDNYANYPTDLRLCFDEIETVIDGIVVELNAARLADATIPLDSVRSDLHRTAINGDGRFAPWEVLVTFSGANVTITSGRALMNNQKITVVGATLGVVAASGDHYVATDQSGLLSISTSPNQSFFDIARLTVAASVFTGVFADNLDPTAGQRRPLMTGDTANRIMHRVAGNSSLVGRQDPSIRCVGDDGTQEDAGFHHRGDPSNFAWVSQRDGGEGVGNTIEAAIFAPFGQFLLLEQGRVMAERTTNQSITQNVLTAITFDAPVANAAGNPTRREPEAYFTDPWYSAATATLTVPTNAGLDGTYMFSAFITIDSSDETLVDARIVQTVGGSAVIARARCAPAGTGPTVLCLSGMYDLLNTDAFQLQIEHNATAALNVTQARLTAMLLGGGV